MVKRSSDRCRKRKLTSAEKEADTSVDLPVIHQITVDPWVEHLDIWCDLMWYFRQPDADWAIVDPYFCPLVMEFKDVPFWPAIRVNLGVPPNENRKWWKKIRLRFENIIPSYLDECWVLKAKSISLENYKIKFEAADNVPTQGDAYRDCGVWVCIFLHRLCQNLSVSTDHAPVHVGLAHCEHMVDYLWKYRLPEVRFKSIGNFD
ncbi:ulp1 protease family, C-terminal catalytic domain-containing protein [Tanacetum coccineum]